LRNPVQFEYNFEGGGHMTTDRIVAVAAALTAAAFIAVATALRDKTRGKV